MKQIDRTYIILGLVYAVVGMVLGIYMASSHNHTQHVTHAHVMLVGFVVSVIYGVIYKIWITQSPTWLMKVQFWLHQFGAFLISCGLFLLYGGLIEPSSIEPILAIASISVLIAVTMLLAIVVKC